MRAVLIVVDMQNDFITGPLGNDETKAVVKPVIEKIRKWDGELIATMDKHDLYTYCDLAEGLIVPEHCMTGTSGAHIHKDVLDAIKSHKNNLFLDKHNCFGSKELCEYISRRKPDCVEIIGICTDICVISNALMLRSMCPDLHIVVDAECCTGTSIEAHEAALKVMENCCIEIMR